MYIFICTFTEYTYNYTGSYAFIEIIWYVQLSQYLYLSVLTTVLVFTLS